MEKQSKAPPVRRGFVTVCIAAFAVLSLILLNKFFVDLFDHSHPQLEPRNNASFITPLTFQWSKIAPSPNLKWQACGKRRECARLELPIDYLDPDSGNIAVALIRVPATNKEYRGPILLNPGGPGNSGVMFADEVGDTLQKLIGDEYDIVGFDQRGVGATTPKLSNFLDDAERGLWDAAVPPLVNSTPDAFMRVYSRADIFGRLAVSRSNDIAQYVGTAAVARDMLNITNAFGFEKLKYWGLSYGSVLGGTFAAMFPEYVERLIIDGVVEFSDYYSGRWYSNLLDTDTGLEYVYQACVAAGDDCPLHEPTPSKVGARVQTILNSLKQKLVPVLNNTEYTILDYGNVKGELFYALYRPFARMEVFFNALAALEKGDPQPMLGVVGGNDVPKCGAILKSSVVPISVAEGKVAIRCGDGQGVGFEIDDLQRHMKELGELSFFADIWSQLRIECSGWKLPAKERYGGDFNKTTSFPLLIIGNTRDPVTPLYAAKKASEGFRNSALLTIDTPGHCLIAATSPVALKFIRDYFRDGALPPKGTVCPIEDRLFTADSHNLIDPEMSEEDKQFLELTKEFVQRMHEATKGLYL